MHCAPEANCNWQTPVSKCPLPVWAAASRLPVKIEPTSHPQGSLVLPAQQGRPRTSKCRAESPTCVHESQLVRLGLLWKWKICAFKKLMLCSVESILKGCDSYWM